MPIKDDAYNKAAKALTSGGSKTASKTHNSHTGGKDRPDSHGQDLIDQATAEFQKLDKDGKDLTAGMTAAHLKTINDAKKALGLK